jgi:hypothetical protein
VPMKYVMLKLGSGEMLPLIFPEFMQHSVMAQSVPAAVISAGRVFLEDGRLVARDGSSSLHVSAREQDSEIIQGYFDGQHVVQQEL